MPDFAALDVGTRGREWWRRCQPQIGYALAVSALIGFLIWAGLAVRQVGPDTLILWSKYEFARAADMVGLSSVTLAWPDLRDGSVIPVAELLKRPDLEAWAEPVSKKVGDGGAPALLGGFLAFLATLLWSVSRALPEQADGGASESVVTEPEPPQAEAETEVPETLPPVLPTEEHPDPFSHGPEAGPDPPPVVAAPLEPPLAVADVPLPVTLPPVPPPEELPLHDGPGAELDLQARIPAPQPPLVLPPSPPPAHPATQPPGTAATAPAGKSNFSYETYWGLTELPFENVPDPKFYFPTSMHEEALHRLLYGVQTRKGALLLTGEVGCGKTLLSRELSLHLSGQQYDVALIANPSFRTEDFLTEVLYQLGIEPTKTKVELLHLLNGRLLENYKRGKQTVVVIDEAQTIQEDQIFEELRLLLNFQLNDRFLLTLVLMGQPELNDRVMSLKQFTQRISIKYHLGFFSAQQTAEYVRFRLKTVKCAREVFNEEALDLIFKHSGGVPRNINTLCDLCLLIGYMDRAAGVDRKIVERAAAERGQLGLF